MFLASEKWLVNGPGGSDFGKHRIPRGASIRRFYVHSDAFIDGIQIEFETESGCAGQLPYLGGVGGRRRFWQVPRDARILGFSVGGAEFLETLQIHTNRGSSPRYGNGYAETTFFRVEPGHAFCGVFGRCGWYLDALGILQEPEEALVRGDHLFRLPGIGPTTVKVLEEAGLGSCSKLAASEAKVIMVELRKRGLRPRRESVGRWLESATRYVS